MMEQKYGENFGNTFKLDKIPETLDEFKEDCLRRIEFVMRDAQIKKVRRFCNKEQYRDEKIAALTSKHQMNGNQDMYALILEKMISQKLSTRILWLTIAFVVIFYDVTVFSYFVLPDGFLLKKNSVINFNTSENLWKESLELLISCTMQDYWKCMVSY